MPSRLENNAAIVDILHEIVNNNPDLRFCQILDIIGLRLTEERFYEEPWHTLKRILDDRNLDKLLNGSILDQIIFYFTYFWINKLHDSR